MSLIVQTIDIEATMRKIGEHQLQIRSMKRDIKTAMVNVIENSELLVDNVFYDLLYQLTKTIKCHAGGECFSIGDAKMGCNDFIHNVTFGFVCGIKTDVHAALSFVKTYREKSHRIFEALSGVVTGLSDDGYSDLADSFLLNGKKAAMDALNGRLSADLPNQGYLGENYITNNLFEAVCETVAEAYASDLSTESEDED